MSNQSNSSRNISTNPAIPYITGFLLSLALTFGAYMMVQVHLNSGHMTPTDFTLMIFLAILAISQLFVQLYYFLHLGKESKPQWNLMLFLFAGLVVAIIVFGSLWIMKNLNYHMMSPSQTEMFIIKDERVHK